MGQESYPTNQEAIVDITNGNYDETKVYYYRLNTDDARQKKQIQKIH